MGSRVTTATIPYDEALQLILSQMDADISNSRGLSNVKSRIAYDKLTHLSRDFISEVMHAFDPDGFENREPGSKKIIRVKKCPIGIHERWAGDGHDKLYSIGFPIWGVVDDATSRWLGAWVVPSNRMGSVVAYLFLCLVEDIGGQLFKLFPLSKSSRTSNIVSGLPLEFSTDCGSETTQIYGIVNALRSVLSLQRHISHLNYFRFNVGKCFILTSILRCSLLTVMYAAYITSELSAPGFAYG
jgi:hypothetical protein